MAIQHTAVSYYGINYTEHAEADFKEMKEHGCDTVILAITEFDMDFWFPNINNIVKTAHALGLRVIADLWGIGKYFGGEQVSLFCKIIFITVRFRHTRARCLTPLALTPTHSAIISRVYV